MTFNPNVPDPEYIGTDKEAAELLRLLMRKVEEEPDDFMGFDTETYGKKLPIKGRNLDWVTDKVTLWSLSCTLENEYRRWCIPGQYFQFFSPLLENPLLNVAGFNLKYDAHISWNCRVNIWNCRTLIDGLALIKLIDENRMASDLKTTAEEYCGLRMTKYKSLFKGVIDPKTGKEAKEYETSLLDLIEAGHIDKVSNYASYDAFAHLRLFERLRDILRITPIGTDGDNMWEYFLRMEMHVTEVLWRMERRGMCLDLGYLQDLIPEIDGKIKEAERDVNRIASTVINVNSPAQLADLFFSNNELKGGGQGFGLQPIKLTKSRAASTDKDVMAALTELGGEAGEVARLVVAIRTLSKTKNTYMENLRKLAEYFPDGRIHPSFNQFGAATGRFSTNNPNCVDGETEVLTTQGWVRFDKLEAWEDEPDMVAPLVAQWVPKTGTIEFVQAGLIEQHYTGEMVHVENQHIDLLMTPNHRCPLINRQTGELQVLEAKDYKEDKKQLHAGHWFRSAEDTPLSSSISYSQLTFLIAVQADGHWHGGGIDFGFNKKRKADRLLATLENIGANFSYKEGGSAEYRFRVKAGDLVEWAKDLLGEDKIFWDWITMLSSDQLKFFSEEVFFWDGCWDRKSMYASKYKKNADWVQIALTLCGKRAKVRKYETPEGRADSWQVDVTGRDYSMTTNIKRSRRSWDGTVYCVSVPSGFFVVRRNGKACITGNSQNFPRPDNDEWGIRKAFIAPPGKKLIVADYEQLEMRIMADRSRDKAMIQAILDGKDLHSFTAASMTPGVKYEEVVAAKKTNEPDPAQKMLKLLRQDMKAVGFGIIYGAGPKKIGESIEILEEDIRQRLASMDSSKLKRRVSSKMRGNPLLTEEEAIVKVARESIAGDKIQSYFKVFPGVKAYMEDIPAWCRESMYVDLDGNDLEWHFFEHEDWPGSVEMTVFGHVRPFGYVQTLVGRYRRLEDIDHDKFMLRSAAERQAINTPIQGSASDLIKGAMLRIEFNDELNRLGVELVNQVHDELVMEVPEENAEAASPIVKACMETPFEDEDGEPWNPLCVPIPVDLKVVDVWASAK